MKRIILIIGLVIFYIITNVGANAAYITKDNYKYRIEDGKVIVLEYIGSEDTVKIPKEIDGFPVVSLGYKNSGEIFGNVNQDKTKKVIIPEGVECVASGFFFQYIALEDVTIPDSINFIGNSAFKQCNSLKEITIPQSVTEGEPHSFRECENLKTVTILNSTVSESMFSHCTSLETLNLSDNVTTIGRWAFNHCHSLKRVVIPDSVNSIGYKAFCASGVEEVIISSDVTNLEYGVFLNCRNLRTVIFKNQNTEFEEKHGEMPNPHEGERNPTFEGCESLTDIYAFTGTQAQTFAINNGINFIQIARVEVNGEEVKTDVPPIVRNNRVLMPMRAIFESLGATVEWNGETQTITAKTDAKNIVLPLNSNTMTVNNEVKTLDVGTEVIMERTLVPVRAISESIGADVKWDAERQTVVVTY